MLFHAVCLSVGGHKCQNQTVQGRCWRMSIASLARGSLHRTLVACWNPCGLRSWIIWLSIRGLERQCLNKSYLLLRRILGRCASRQRIIVLGQMHASTRYHIDISRIRFQMAAWNKEWLLHASQGLWFFGVLIYGAIKTWAPSSAEHGSWANLRGVLALIPNIVVLTKPSFWALRTIPSAVCRLL